MGCAFFFCTRHGKREGSHGRSKNGEGCLAAVGGD